MYLNFSFFFLLYFFTFLKNLNIFFVFFLDKRPTNRKNIFYKPVIQLVSVFLISTSYIIYWVTLLKISPYTCAIKLLEFPGSSDGKEKKKSTCNAGDLDSIPGSGRSPGEKNGSPLQWSYLENSTNRGSW